MLRDMSGKSGERVRGRLTVGNRGWVCYRASDLDDPIWVRLVEAEDGRLVVADLFVPFEAPPTVRHLRHVAERVGRAETLANGPEVRDMIRDGMRVLGPDLRTAVSYFASSFGARAEDHWVRRMFLAQVEGSDEPRPEPKPTPAKPEPIRESNGLELVRPESKPYPEAFWRDVAETYFRASTFSERPAAEIAEASGLPVRTVHRWVAEARKRGHLAPTRPGRAG